MKMLFTNNLTFHALGVLNHGRNRFTLYRTFGNVKVDSNLAVHVWLIELQQEIDEKGILPGTIYNQMDGGSENANKLMFGVAELLIAKGLCQKVVLTRLPPGHTHEDIDAKYGVIWKRFRNDHVTTPQSAARKFKEAFKSASDCKGLKVEVTDIFVVPDYWSYIVPHIDKNLSRAFKEEWTQLQWSFEKVPVSEFYPLGISKTSPI
jgi:hypothetical protein